MKKSLLLLFAISAILGMSGALVACDDSSAPPMAPTDNNGESKVTAIPVDYSAGRAMNKRLGKGINLGNSWDSDGKDDGGWGNPIKDEDFKIIKEAGFNSIRLPVRWQKNSNYETHTVDPDRLAGVKEDVTLAINEGLVVLLDFHHYVELNALAKAAQRKRGDSVALFQAEKTHFIELWRQIATEFNTFPDSMIAFDIFNEPTITSTETLNDVLLGAYQAIRAAAPKKTIMFESSGYAKFAQITALKLPQDGNIIFSGHYYEPYTFSHQGHSYSCIGDAAYSNKADSDFKGYTATAKELYPDVNGTDYIPMNMGEFGISGGTNQATKNRYVCEADQPLPSASAKAQWAKETVEAAKKYGMSFHYWGFTKVGGFEAYDRQNSTWYSGFPKSLIN